MSQTPNDKPLGASLGWELLGTTRPYESRWHNLRRDEIRLPGGQEIVYTYQEHAGFVTVLPVTADGQVVMIRSYRYTVDDWCWELPAGGLGDKLGCSPEEVARQELREETGADCLEMRQIGWFYAMNGTSSARCTFFLATGVQLNGPPELEATELSEVHLMPLEQAVQMARDGRITDADSALVLLRCEPILRGQGRQVEVVPYDQAWPRLFEAEAASLAALLGDELVSIHHIGSTSVPGLLAKPIVDILPVVRDIERIDTLNDLLLAAGYVPKGENGIPGRRFFTKDVVGVRRVHVHAFAAGHPEIARHLDFVAFLRAHPADAQAYADLKRDLARRFPNDTVGYTEAKSEFIRAVDARAKAS
ncbi:MAG: GrpB family protein [Anaerolineae bacterium]